MYCKSANTIMKDYYNLIKLNSVNQSINQNSFFCTQKQLKVKFGAYI